MSLKLFLNVIMHNVFSLSFLLLLVIDHLRLRIGWLTIEDWKMDEDGSADE